MAKTPREPVAGQQPKQAKPPKGPSYKELEAERDTALADLEEAKAIIIGQGEQNIRLQTWLAATLVAQTQAGWATMPDLMGQAMAETVNRTVAQPAQAEAPAERTEEDEV